VQLAVKAHVGEDGLRRLAEKTGAFARPQMHAHAAQKRVLGSERRPPRLAQTQVKERPTFGVVCGLPTFADTDTFQPLAVSRRRWRSRMIGLPVPRSGV